MLSKERISEISSLASLSSIVRACGCHIEQNGDKKFKTKCPFHEEKTPSFHIDDNNGVYYCFGCGEGGNTISFVMKQKGLNFIEALKFVADSVGIKIENELKTFAEAKKAEEQYETLYRIFEEATKFYVQSLHSPSGAECLKYFKNNRKLHDKTIALFRLGFSPNGSLLYKHLKSLEFKDDDLVKSGLVRKGAGGFLDFFFNRAMMPILNNQGAVVGFGGRILVSINDAPKYINTPESPIFKKKDILFNLQRAILAGQAKGQKNLVIVEGYMDVIMANQCGIDCLVAPLGTAITENQIKTILTKSNEPIICFNSDEAGKRASLRCAEKFLTLIKAGNAPRFVELVNAKDIDEFIQKTVPTKAFETLSELFSPDQTTTLQDFLFNHLIVPVNSMYDKDPNKVALMSKEAARLCGLITDHDIKEAYLKYFKHKINEAIFFFSKSNKFGNKRLHINAKMLSKKNVSDPLINYIKILQIMICNPDIVPDALDELSGTPMPPEIEEELTSIAVNKEITSQAIKQKLLQFEVIKLDSNVALGAIKNLKNNIGILELNKQLKLATGVAAALIKREIEIIKKEMATTLDNNDED